MTTQKERADRIRQNEKFNFVAFSKDEAYRRATVELLERVFPALPQTFYHVDVATGTGLVPQALGKMAQDGGKTARIIGIDPDPFAIDDARKSVEPLQSEQTRFVFLEGYGQDTADLVRGKIPEQGADSVSIHDAIHEIPGDEGKQDTLASMFQITKPGGLLTLNSAFTSLALMDKPYALWKGAVVRETGRERDKDNKSIDALSPEKYIEMITKAGFEVVDQRTKKVELSRDALVGISQYPEFINGFFRDIRGQEEIAMEEKSVMMIRALDSTMQRLNVQSFPRTWWDLIARKAK